MVNKEKTDSWEGAALILVKTVPLHRRMKLKLSLLFLSLRVHPAQQANQDRLVLKERTIEQLF